MTDPTSPMPPEQPAGPPQPATPLHTSPQLTPPPAGTAVPPPGAPLPPGATLPGAATLPAQRSSARAWAVGGIALVIALCCGGVGIAALSDNEAEPAVEASASVSASPSTAAPATAAAAPTTEPPAPTYETPTKNDFKLKVKVLSKRCFGSAGCNITYRIDVTYTGTGLDPSRTYEVTYAVKGAEDPIINTFEVTGDSASVQQEEMASTKRSGDKLTAVVTSVSEF